VSIMHGWRDRPDVRFTRKNDQAIRSPALWSDFTKIASEKKKILRGWFLERFVEVYGP
jgi:hypothetical protein